MFIQSTKQDKTHARTLTVIWEGFLPTYRLHGHQGCSTRQSQAYCFAETLDSCVCVNFTHANNKSDPSAQTTTALYESHYSNILNQRWNTGFHLFISTTRDGRACSTHGIKQKYIKYFGRKTWKVETSWKFFLFILKSINKLCWKNAKFLNTSNKAGDSCALNLSSLTGL